MTNEKVVALLWLAGVALVAVMLVAAFRARKRGTASRGAIGAIWEMQSHDRRQALEMIVENRAEARRPENRDGNLPDLDDPSPR
jgi:hypothetical protein